MAAVQQYDNFGLKHERLASGAQRLRRVASKPLLARTGTLAILTRHPRPPIIPSR
jgi:hypothetical protein